LKYCDHLIDKLSLRNNIVDLLSILVPKDQTLQIFELIRNIIYYHDLGKINPEFQKEKIGNPLDIQTDNLNTHHSFYGNMLFDHMFYENFQSNIKTKIIFYLLSQIISRHHTSLKDIDFLYYSIQKDNYDDESKDLKNISERLFHNYEDKYAIKDFVDLYNFKTEDECDIRRIFNTTEQQEALFYLYKITYSLLILSDYYATSDYLQSISYFDKISTLDSDLIRRCKDNFYKTKEYNAKLQDQSSCEKIRSCMPENDFYKLRTKILLEADDNLKKNILEHPDNRVFYLRVPTGGGKTNISIKLALTLLESKKNINRIFYIFPFINIIEQNHKVIKKTLGLDDEIAPIYSTSSWDKEGDENERLQYTLDNEFLNYPFVIMSNVNFFNTFVKAGKGTSYRLINLANSIIIIDEIQSVNDKQWTLFNDIITYASKCLNIYFIIMSATLPKLDLLFDPNDKSSICNLIEDPNVYFSHKKFSNRTQMIYRDDINNLDSLYNLLKQECKDRKKILVVVNKVKQSLDLYKKIKEDEELSKDFDILLLNSTILPHRRQAIIKEMDTDKKILISTQSVEAGVDVDCDFGIRDMAIFDSLEQVAGRINRNSNDDSPSKLIITNLKNNDKRDAESIYKGSHRWKTIDEKFHSKEDIQNFLTTRDFDDYYDKVLCHIKSINNSAIQSSSKDIVVKGIRHMDFEELNKVNIIEQDSLSFIVDIELDKDLFKQTELEYFEINTNKVSGREVWEKYHEFLNDFKNGRQRGHVKRKINTKIWSSIISKFTINIRNNTIQKNSKDDNKIPLLKKEYYSEEEGLSNELPQDYFEVFENPT